MVNPQTAGFHMPSPATHPKVLIFDVNETLLDMAPIKQAIDDLLQ